VQPGGGGNEGHDAWMRVSTFRDLLQSWFVPTELKSKHPQLSFWLQQTGSTLSKPPKVRPNLS
jgi:hypothetical protein